MQWQRIRERYPAQWLLEAIEAHSSEGRRHLDDLTVVQEYPNGEDAMRGYLDLHRRSPERELYVLHTDRETLDMDVREWLGLRVDSQSYIEPWKGQFLREDVAWGLEGTD